MKNWFSLAVGTVLLGGSMLAQTPPTQNSPSSSAVELPSAPSAAVPRPTASAPKSAPTNNSASPPASDAKPLLRNLNNPKQNGTNTAPAKPSPKDSLTPPP